MKQESGFTLIELIVVLVIIGILGAIALPRFFDLTVSAHDANVRATANNLDSAINMARAQHEVEGRDGSISVDGTAVDFTATGGQVEPWPVAASAADCVSIFNALMEAGSFTDGALAAAAAGGGEYVATFASSSCTYSYDKEDTNTRTITYDTSNGEVSVSIS